MEQTRRVHLFRDALVHRWKTVALFLLLGSLAGALLSLQRPETYSSNAAIIVNPLIGNPYTTEDQGDDLLNLQSEAQLVTSDAVTSAVAGELGIDENSPVFDSGVEVTSPPNTQILEITVSGNDPDIVQDVSAELAEGYLGYRMELAESSVTTQSEVLQARIDETEDRLSTAQELATTGPPDERGLQTRLSAGYEADLFTLRAELIGVESTPVTPGRITTRATEPVSSSWYFRWIIAGLGVLGGLLLGIAVAVGRERRANVVRNGDDVTELDIPILADLSPSRRSAKRTDATSRLRMEVLARVTPPLTILVAPCSPHGSHHLPIGLAQSIADLGVTCVLVDTDGDALPERAGVPAAPGLADMMLHGRRPAELLQPVGSNLQVLTAGTDLAAAQDLFVTSQLVQQFERLRPHAALTIVQAPNLSDIAGEALTGVADAVIVVVTLHRTTLRELQRVQSLLKSRGVSLLGAVLTRTNTEVEWTGPDPGVADRSPARHLVPPAELETERT